MVHGGFSSCFIPISTMAHGGFSSYFLPISKMAHGGFSSYFIPISTMAHGGFSSYFIPISTMVHGGFSYLKINKRGSPLCKLLGAEEIGIFWLVDSYWGYLISHWLAKLLIMVGFSIKPNAETAVCHWIMIWCWLLLTKIDVMYIVQDGWGLLADEKSMCFAHAQMDVSAETRRQLNRSLCVKGFSTLHLHQIRGSSRWTAESVQVIQGYIGIHIWIYEYMKNWELIFFERVARCTSKCYRRL